MNEASLQTSKPQSKDDKHNHADLTDRLEVEWASAAALAARKNSWLWVAWLAWLSWVASIFEMKFEVVLGMNCGLVLYVNFGVVLGVNFRDDFRGQFWGRF